ncbi:MAG: hypothetical protein ACOVMM_01455 [Chitinophagaceae bacterium]
MKTLVLTVFITSVTNIIGQDNFTISIYKKIDSVVLKDYSKLDSQNCKKYFNNNFKVFKQYKEKYWIPNAKRSMTWGKLEKYLLIDSNTIKNHALKEKIYSSWYFLHFLRSDFFKSKNKTKLFTDLKKRAVLNFGISFINETNNFDFNQLLTYIQLKATKELRVHRH